MYDYFRNAKSYVDAHSGDLNRLQHFKESRIRVSKEIEHTSILSVEDPGLDGSLLDISPGGRFSKVPKLYGPFSSVTIPFVSQERRGFNSSNFTVIFCFVPLKTC